MYTYYTCSTYILYWSACTIVLQAYTTQEEGVNSLTHRKCIVLNGNFVLDFYDTFRNITQAQNEACLYVFSGGCVSNMPAEC